MRVSKIKIADVARQKRFLFLPGLNLHFPLKTTVKNFLTPAKTKSVFARLHPEMTVS